MRKAVVAMLSVAILAGPMASVASADPVREAYCKVLDLLGYEHVQECNYTSDS